MVKLLQCTYIADHIHACWGIPVPQSEGLLPEWSTFPSIYNNVMLSWY